ncbi:hypothetical protein AHF37_08608 [Paragonimus kellicotti]|nr:hypothetical protein AHF37_08608 [Paragonimus kellicotti]
MRCDTSQTQRKMRAVPVVISLLVLLDGALAQAESAPKTLSSKYLVGGRENDTMQVQTGVCSQITSLVPWYQAQNDSSTCTVTIGEQRVHANYTILTTDDFLRKYDPSCVTYDILLANQVIVLNQPVCLAQGQQQSEWMVHCIRQRDCWDGAKLKCGRCNQRSRRERDKSVCKVSESATEVKNWSRPPWIHVVFYSNTSYLWKQVNILDEKSADTTASPAPEQTSTSSGFVTTVRTTTRGDEKSDGRSADTTTASPAPEQTSTSSGSVTTVRTTTRGGVARITWRLASMIPLLLTFSALLAIDWLCQWSRVRLSHIQL